MPRKTLSFRYYSLLMVLLVCGCSSLGPKPNQAPPPFILLSPHTLGQTINLYQEVELHFDNERFILQAAITIDNKLMQLATMTPLGQRLLTLSYDGETQTIMQHFRQPADGYQEHALRDIQWLFWPIEILNQASASHGWRFEETTGTRTIYYNGHLVAKIHKKTENAWNGTYAYENHAYNYRLDLKSIHIVN